MTGRSSTNRTPAREATAFTLVELLVVIGIIAVLIGILLPVLSRAQEASRSTMCRSNLRQIYQGLQMYAHDNKDRFPDKFSMGNWNYRRLPGMKNPADPGSYPEWMGMPAVLHGIKVTDYDFNMSPLDVQQKLSVALARKGIWLTARGGVWACPSYPARFEEYGNTYWWSNATIMGNETSIKRRLSAKQASTEFHGEWLVCDNFNFLPYTPGAMAPKSVGSAYTLSPDTKWVIPHRGKAGPRTAINMLFMDGHVSMLTRRSGGGPAWAEN